MSPYTPRTPLVRSLRCNVFITTVDSQVAGVKEAGVMWPTISCVITMERWNLCTIIGLMNLSVYELVKNLHEKFAKHEFICTHNDDGYRTIHIVQQHGVNFSESSELVKLQRASKTKME